MDYYNIHTHCFPAGREEDVFTLYNTAPEDFLLLPSLPPNCGVSVGIHPWRLDSKEDWEDTLLQMGSLLSRKEVMAVGECGLDGNVPVPLPVQLKWFRAQTELAEATSRPVIIHCVKAYNDLIRARKEWHPRQPWIIHGFRGKPELGAELIRHGFYLSLGLHFNRQLCTQVSPEYLFLETDDSPVSVRRVYEEAAEVWNISAGVLQRQIGSNFNLLFAGSR